MYKGKTASGIVPVDNVVEEVKQVFEACGDAGKN